MIKTNILEKYLKSITKNDLDDILNKYEKFEIYDNEKDIEIGLLRFKNPPKTKAFLFILPEEKKAVFHTIGMKFHIDIYFFDSNKKLINSFKKVRPGIEFIFSKKPAKYVLEIVS